MLQKKLIRLRRNNLHNLFILLNIIFIMQLPINREQAIELLKRYNSDVLRIKLLERDIPGLGKYMI